MPFDFPEEGYKGTYLIDMAKQLIAEKGDSLLKEAHETQADICREYAARDARIRYFRQQTNRGGAYNHNFVLAQATAPYFRLFASDDWLLPTCLEKCAKVLDGNPEVVLAWTETTMVDELDRPMDYRTDQPFDNRSPSTRLASLLVPRDDDSLLAQPVLAGGPVHPERGFVLHDGESAWDSTLPITGDLSVTTSRDVLEAIARGEGPANAVVALGCAGWGAGQLEQELVENSWLTVPADPELLFTLPLPLRWQASAGRLGVDLAYMADYSGHA